MEKEVLTVSDFKQMFEISDNKAYEIVASIKSVSDTLGIAGKVHKQDYDFWLKKRLGQPSSRYKSR